MQVSALNLIIAAQQARAPSTPAANAPAPRANAAPPANAFTPQAFPSADTGHIAQPSAPPASGPAAPGSRIDIRV